METIHKTIGQVIDEIAQIHAADLCVVHAESSVRYSYDQMLEEVRNIAVGLFTSGVKKGDRVALWAPNIPEWIISMLALAKIGAVTVPVDPGADGQALSYILEHSGSRGIILAEGLGDISYANTLQAVWTDLPDLNRAFVIGDAPVEGMISWSELKSLGQKARPIPQNGRASITRTDSVFSFPCFTCSGTPASPWRVS